MIIRRVVIENLFSHDHTEIELPEGFVAIRGPNGAGKSSIVESILLALFDRGQASEEILRSGKRSAIRLGAFRAGVELELEIGGRLYRVRRTYTGEGASERHELSELVEGKEKRLAQGVVDVTRHVSRLLGSDDPRVFTSTIFSRQDMLDHILQMGPRERASKILELLGLSELERARESVRKAAERADRELARLSALEEELKRAEKELAEAVRQRGDVEKGLAAVERELAGLRRSLEEAERDLEDLERGVRILGELGRLRRDLEDLRRARASLEAAEKRVSEILRLWGAGSLEDLKSAEEAARESQRCRRELEALEKSAEEAARLVSKSLEDLGRILESAGIQDRDPSTALEEIEKRIRGLEREEGSLRGSLEAYERILRLEAARGRCPFCGRELGPGELEKILEGHRREAEEVRRRIQAVASELGTLRVSAEKAKRIWRSFEELRYRQGDLLRRIGELRACSEKAPKACGSQDLEACLESIRRDLEEITSLGGRAEELRKRISGLEGEGLEEKIRALEAELGQVLGRRQGIPRDPGELEKMAAAVRRRVRELREGVERKEAERGRLAGRLEELARRVGELEKRISEARASLSAKEDLERGLRILRILQEKILGKDGILAQKLTELAVKSLEEEVNRVLERFQRGFSARIGRDFSITISSGGREMPVENLSGGERTMLSIAFRLALARILVGRIPSLMILDEPTQNLDEQNKSRVFEIIREVAGQLRQVIVVTHDEEVEEKADLVYLVEKENGVSKVTAL